MDISMSTRHYVAAWTFAVLAGLLTGCASTPSFAPAKVAIAEPRGEVPILWASIARPAPLPPLDHAAILVPVVFTGVGDRVLYMQFDLGHSSTVLYANKWADLARRANLEDNGEQVATLRFGLGSLSVTASDVAIVKREGAGIDWTSEQVEIIGTIGADLIDGRVVVLDFSNDTILLSRDRNGLSVGAEKFQPFRFQGRRILLPAQFEGRETSVLYDSGSSAFSWLTNEDTFSRLAKPNAVPDRYPIRS